MSDEHLDIDFRFNTPEAKSQLSEIEDSAKAVNAEVEKGNKPLKEREGIIERLKRRIGELRDEQNKATSVTGIARYNSELQKYEQELIRVNRAGRSGFDSNGQAMISNEGILQRLQRAAAIYQKGMMEATRTDNIEKYSQKLALVNAEMAKLTKGANIGGGSGWNGLQNSINQISRELPAFTYSVQTGFMAISNNLPMLADEIGKIKKENEALTASGQKGVPVWKQLVGSLFSWGTALSIGITLLTVYGKEIGNFFAELFKGKTSINQSKRDFEALNSVMSESSKIASQEIAQLKVLSTVAADVTKSTKERKEAAKQLQELGKAHNVQLKTEAILAGEAAAQYRDLAKSILEAARSQAALEKITENEKKRLDLEQKRKKVQNANANEKARYARQGDDLDVTVSNGVLGTSTIKGSTVSDKQLGSDIRANRALKEIDAEMMVLDKTSEFLLKFVKVEEEKKKVKGVGTGENIFERLSDSSKDLIDKIAKLDAEYSRKVLSTDEQELQTLREKFADFRKLIEEENEKILDYNKKYKKNVSTIDINALAPIQSKAESNLSYTQSTAHLQKQYEEEYKLYQQYEELKKSTNEQYANERFASQLDSIKSFEQRLNDEIAKIDPTTTNELERKRFEFLNKVKTDLADKRKSAEDKEMSELLALMITYDQKRKKLIEDYEKKRLEVIKRGNAEELAEFDRHHQEALDKLDDTNIEKLAEVQGLFKGIDKLTDAGARSLIDKIKALLSSDKDMSPELRAKIEEALGEAVKALDDRLPERLDKVAQGFDQIADSIASSNEELASMIGGLSNVLKAVVQIDKGISGLTEGIANYKANKAEGGGGLLGSISAVAGVVGPAGQIIGAVGSVVKGVIGFFKASKESARQAAQAMDEYKQSVLAGELEHNRLMRERERTQRNINELTLEQIELQQQLLKQQTSDVTSTYNNLLDKIQKEGRQITGQKTEKYGGFLGIGKKTRVVDITSGLAGYSYAQLEELYTSKKMTEATARLFEELRKSKDEIDDIAGAWDSLNDEFLNRMSGGVTSSAIANTITEGFKNGKRAVIDFADDMESIVQNALLSALSATVLDEPLQELIKQFREDAKDGLSASEIEKFQQGYGSAVQAGIDALKEVERITGKSLSAGTSSNSSLQSSGVDRMTEQTGTELMGVNRSLLDVSKRHLLAFEKAMEFWQFANNLLVQQLKHQAAIEQNTAATVEQLKLVVEGVRNTNRNLGGKYGL